MIYLTKSLTGKKFGKWIVLGGSPVFKTIGRKRQRVRNHWEVQCQCGRRGSVWERYLLEERSKQCHWCHIQVMVQAAARARHQRALWCEKHQCRKIKKIYESSGKWSGLFCKKCKAERGHQRWENLKNSPRRYKRFLAWIRKYNRERRCAGKESSSTVTVQDELHELSPV